MGDRCWASLRVPAEHSSKAFELLLAAGFLCDGEEVEEYMDPDGKSLLVEAEEVNYGNFDVEDDLVKEGIPYDKINGAGADYPEGLEVFRPATAEREQIYESLSEEAWEMANEIVKRLRECPNKDEIEIYAKGLVARFTIPPLVPKNEEKP